MQPKRGWWKFGEKTLLLVGEHNGRWYGLNHYRETCSWLTKFLIDEFSDRELVFCGDGPEPVEPVQACLGWWDTVNGKPIKVAHNVGEGPFPWVSEERHGPIYWNDTGIAEVPQWQKYNLVKRRPDLDPKPTPDAKDAEIERLTEQAQYWQGAYNALRAKIDKFKDSLE